MDSRNCTDLSVCIITLNEEKRLRRCLESLPEGCEIIVLDSGSSDATIKIAREFGALVSTRVFDNYANQKNAALSLATKSWVLTVDADEQLSPDLKAALAQFKPPANDCCYAISRRLVFMGKTMRFGKTKDAPIRLAPRLGASYEGHIHERLVASEPLNVYTFPVGYLLHDSYENLTDYFAKFNRYTSQIAEQKYARSHAQPSLFGLALRPWWEFLSRYFLRLGFLDGYPGYCYALISSVYGFVKYAKCRELAGERTNPREHV